MASGSPGSAPRPRRSTPRTARAVWTCGRASASAAPGRPPAPTPLSTPASETYPCEVADGSLYFTSGRDGGPGAGDVWRAQRREDGSLAAPLLLPAPVNTPHAEGDVWVSPDETLLVVTSQRPGGHGGNDLWVSHRADDGTWSEPVNLGPDVNTEHHEYCPMGTPSGDLFTFSRRYDEGWGADTRGDVFWVDAKLLEK